MSPRVRWAVDVGTVRVGLARSDPEGILASPVQTVLRDGAGQHDIAAVADLVRAERHSFSVAVGLPRHLAGAEGGSAQDARVWAGRLARLVGSDIAVRLVDERLTTVSAHRQMRAAGVSQKQGRERVDQAAAVGILHTVLEASRQGREIGELVGGRKPRRS